MAKVPSSVTTGCMAAIPAGIGNGFREQSAKLAPVAKSRLKTDSGPVT